MIQLKKLLTTKKKNTIIVRIAVATVESVFSIPHFARIDVSPEKKLNQMQILATLDTTLS